MNYTGVGGAKSKIEEAIADLEKIINKLDSSLINIDNNEEDDFNIDDSAEVPNVQLKEVEKVERINTRVPESSYSN